MNKVSIYKLELTGLSEFEVELLTALRKRGIVEKEYKGSIQIYFDDDIRIRSVHVKDIYD